MKDPFFVGFKMKHFQNPPGGPKRNHNVFKWISFFIRHCFNRSPIVPPDFVSPSSEVWKNYQAVQNCIIIS